jgi:hypothetical protein
MAKPPQPLESSRAADAAEQRPLRVSESSQFQAQLRYLAQLLAELHKSWLAVHSMGIPGRDRARRRRAVPL